MICNKQADRKHLQDKVYRIHLAEDNICRLCVKIFLSPEDLEIHRLRIHTKEHSYYCILCSFKSDLLICCEDHIMKSHSKQNLSVISIPKDALYMYEDCDKSFHCKLCEFVSYSQPAMIMHVKKPHLDIKNQQCELCDETFDNLSTLDIHTCTHTSEKSYKCTKQDGLSTDGNSNDLSEVIKQDEYLILDDPEIEISESSSLLDVSKQNELKTKQTTAKPVEITNEAYYVILNEIYRCTICPFGTKKLTKIEQHFKEHNISTVTEVPYIHYNIACNEMNSKLKDYQYEFCNTFYWCKVCGFRSVGHEPIKRHVNKFHLNITSLCEVCNKYFLFSSVELLESTTKQYTCLKCDYTSFQPLNKHMEIHPNKCFECDVTCYKPKPLADQIINNGNYTYYCNVCSFKSNMLSYYKVHMKSHSEQNIRVIFISKDAFYMYEDCDKSFRCKLCKYKCYDQPAIILHVNKPHSDIKHQCELCSEKFDNLTTLDNHKCIHTSEKPYKDTRQDGLSNDLNSTNLSEVIKQEEYLILDDPEIKVKKSMPNPRPKQNGEITKNEACYVLIRKMYRCTICPFGTKEFAKIKHHFKSHDISSIKRGRYDVLCKEMWNNLSNYLYEFCDTFYQCKVCAFKSPEHELINQHVDNFHINVTSRCEICNTFFESSTVLTLHNDDRITKQYTCLTCEYTSFEPLAKHMESHPNKCFKCDVTSSKPLAEQMDDCKTGTIYYCSLCSCKFSIESSWFVHKYSKCHSQLPQLISVFKDSQYEYEDQIFQCKLCDFKCYNHWRMKEHIDKIHLKIKHIQCELCGKTFYNQKIFRIHMRRHTGEKRFKCTQCDYTGYDSISIHMEVHNKIKPHQCNVCEYKSARPARLKVHMRTHTGEKPFKCFICDYAATHKVSLVNHMKKKHTNVV